VPNRLAPLAVLALAIALLGGCGDSSSDESDGSRARTVQQKQGEARAPVGAVANSCDTHMVDVEALRATGLPCDRARQVMYGWQRERSCSAPAGASRTSCLTGSYRCLGAHTDRGIAVSCARRGQSIAFIAKRD
jgi:hypothetical protein